MRPRGQEPQPFRIAPVCVTAGPGKPQNLQLVQRQPTRDLSGEDRAPRGFAVTQRSVWDFMVQKAGVRQARRIASFVECWWVSQVVWETTPTAEMLTDDWGYSDYEVSYWLTEFHAVFGSEADPARLAAFLSEEHGYSGVLQLRRTALRGFTSGA
jgi:hypothetical protein